MSWCKYVKTPINELALVGWAILTEYGPRDLPTECLKALVTTTPWGYQLRSSIRNDLVLLEFFPIIIEHSGVVAKAGARLCKVDGCKNWMELTFDGQSNSKRRPQISHTNTNQKMNANLVIDGDLSGTGTIQESWIISTAQTHAMAVDSRREFRFILRRSHLRGIRIPVLDCICLQEPNGFVVSRFYCLTLGFRKTQAPLLTSPVPIWELRNVIKRPYIVC